jgi:hypothetical protein
VAADWRAVRMPKDYFEVEEVQEQQSEEDKQAKVVEFVYQVTRKSCPPGEFTSWLQDGRSVLLNTMAAVLSFHRVSIY